MNNEMTPKQSLNIISDAIMKSRKEFEKNSAAPLILWGSATIITAIGVGLLWGNTSNPHWNLLWFAYAPIVYLIQKFCLKSEVFASKSFISDVLGYIWMCFGIFAVSTGVIGILLGGQTSITAAILLLMGMAAAISGMVVKNIWMTIGGNISGPGLVFAMKYVEYEADVMLLLAAAALLCLLLPGLYLKFKKNK